MVASSEERRTAYINLAGEINDKSISRLMSVVQTKMAEGIDRFVILISSRGGEVSAGLAAYNFLKGVPAEVITHNYGVADSMAVPIFCAGQERYCSPNARFSLHGVGFNAKEGQRFEEKQLNERLNTIKSENEIIARAIAENCNKSPDEVESDMVEVKTLNATEAQEYGLIHEIKTDLFPKGVEVILIGQT